VRLGAHMSVAGGFEQAIERAARVGANALQIFVKSARRWEAAPIDAQQARAFADRLRRADLTDHTLAHSSYLINLASPERSLRERSIAALREEMERCEQLGVRYLVLHPGAHTGRGERTGLDRVARALQRSLRNRRRAVAPSVQLLLETTAGQGTGLGCRFEQLGWILDRIGEEERLGVCFDTCHVFAAGYDLRDADSYRRTMRELDRTVGLRRLKAFHLNDSKHPLGSRKDRHEHIGRGELGLGAFRSIMGDRRFRGLPMLLETPKGEDLSQDRRNLAVLRRMIDS